MKTNKKELTVFALCAYAIPFLMMPLLYICLQNGRDTSIFANAQMFYPAAGVMLAFLLARRQGTPKRFYILHIAATALMLVMSVLSAFLPQEGWLNIANFVIIIASVLGWIFLLTEKKTKREDYGLCLHGKFLTADVRIRQEVTVRAVRNAAALEVRHRIVRPVVLHVVEGGRRARRTGVHARAAQVAARVARDHIHAVLRAVSGGESAPLDWL